MRLIVAVIFLAWVSSAQSGDTPLILQKPDPQSRFQEAQVHVRELMNAGRYKEASEFMPEYQRLSCEASEQKAGKSIEEGAAICAQKHQAGMGTPLLQQPGPAANEPAPSSMVAPGISVMERHVPGSPTLLDGSAPSLFMFDPRTDPGSAASHPRDEIQVDSWTGKR